MTIRQLEHACWVLEPDGTHWAEQDDAAGAAERARAEGLPGAVESVLSAPCWVADCDHDLHIDCLDSFGDEDEGWAHLHAPARDDLVGWLAEAGWTVTEDGHVQCPGAP
jgi:hypothetical protein